jgi:nucleotide-binding universal stress UspA family protein
LIAVYRKAGTVNIKSMLMRLQSALHRNDLLTQLVLLPGQSIPATGTINLVVGYNSSPKSHAALDLTLWIAHQTRLATGREVMVQVVYVADGNSISQYLDSYAIGSSDPVCEVEIGSDQPGGVRTLVRTISVTKKPEVFQAELLRQADQALWQARCLANEWRGSLKTHLRFGQPATELADVVASEQAALLILGCTTANHPIVRKLGANFPCPVLGIPSLP